ncbi:HlyD family efflux transporter periplasmic adaptor subunit [Xanthobacter sp. KR7-65]|uniref:HlyD family secretion protein n=1 Tax=Xanthobacter sp. KR7-65 TaxID=3156612 RepID=UPI0032B45DB2
MNARFLVIAALTAIGICGCSGAGGSGGYSGYVEGDLVFVGPTEPGRVKELLVDEGAVVKAGQVLAKVEDDLQLADRDAAAAQLKEAEARLADARAPLQRPEEIAVLEASERRAASALDLSRIELDRQKSLVPKGASSQANLDSAQHQYDQNQAALDEARRRIAAARIAARTQSIDAAEQSVLAARANLAAAQVRLDRRTVMAPADGPVQTVYFRPGELVPEGRPIVSLLPPNLVKVRFFVPEAQLPAVTSGAAVTVTCDGCTPFTAKVSFISAQAEYTPPVIYSREERSKLVYLVEARPQDPAKARPGQPVNVTLGAAP